MPATLYVSPVDLPRIPALPLPKIVHRSVRCCPVCAEPRCADADECRAAFDTFEWMDCPACEGTGYDTNEFQIFCPVCDGAKVLEAGIEDVQAVAA
ncbi:hypothetical protein AB0K47_00425 [Streptomyces tirandamycinicus]|uniref:hypothetical protein n=1 Tax=Streptomyces tirandamycinicus TaxID=2174846 RepID=UPI003438BB71